jgi:hypothetical protein
MRRHFIGLGLAVVTVIVMFFAGAWGYERLLRLPAPAAAPLSALPAQGGSLLSNKNVLEAFGAVAAAALLIGILVAVPRISALAAGLPGLLAIAWTAVYAVSVHRAVEVIPFKAHAWGAGWEALLFNGILGAIGLVMVIPLFLPSRWRNPYASQREVEESETSEAQDYVADLKEPVTAGSVRTSAGAVRTTGGMRTIEPTQVTRQVPTTGPAATRPRPGAGPAATGPFSTRQPASRPRPGTPGASGQ